MGGSTNIYDSSKEALQILSKEDTNAYNVSVVLMTDGVSNYGNYATLYNTYRNLEEVESEFFYLDSNAKIFDGRTDLLAAFKQVRGFN